MHVYPPATAPSLPPAFHAVQVADPWEAGLHAAAQGEEPGAVLHAPLGACCRAALILAPDRAVADELVLRLAGLALYDALSSLLPPGIPVVPALRSIGVNGARAASMRVARPPDSTTATPDWLLLGFEVAVALRDPEPGRTPWRTDLAEEGSEASATQVLEVACRYLLVWFNRWHEDGDTAVGAAWRHASGCLAKESA